MPELSMDTFARILKLRVVLSGAGAFRLRGQNGTREGTCVLPGHGTVVFFGDGKGGAPWVRMHYPDGPPLCGNILLAAPRTFALIMHNADAEIWRTDQAKRLPREIRDLADLSVSTSDPAVAVEASRLYADGTIADCPDLDPGAPWSIPQEAEPFVAACAASCDHAMKSAAMAVTAVSDGLAQPRPPELTESALRWRRLVEEWTSGPSMGAEHGIPRI